jgi:hypothetical protein
VKAKQTNNVGRLQKAIRRHIKLAIIPHKANQYRPHLIRHYGLVGVLVLIIVMQVGYNFVVTGTVLGEETAITTETLLASTNKERVKQQLPPLQNDNRLSRAAYLKAKDMFQKQYWAHTAPDGATPWKWFGSVGYNYAYAGENLARNFRTSNTTVTAWMMSPEHKANILNSHYSDVGFSVMNGVLDGKNTTIVVALYGTPASEGVAGVSTAPESHRLGMLARLGMTIQSMSPAALGSVFLMIMVAGVALLTHAYRNKLPKALKESWYRHHGLAKAGAAMVLCFIILVLYSGGQI